MSKQEDALLQEIIWKSKLQNGSNTDKIKIDWFYHLSMLNCDTTQFYEVHHWMLLSDFNEEFRSMVEVVNRGPSNYLNWWLQDRLIWKIHVHYDKDSRKLGSCILRKKWILEVIWWIYDGIETMNEELQHNCSISEAQIPSHQQKQKYRLQLCC